MRGRPTPRSRILLNPKQDCRVPAPLPSPSNSKAEATYDEQRNKRTCLLIVVPPLRISSLFLLVTVTACFRLHSLQPSPALYLTESPLLRTRGTITMRSIAMRNCLPPRHSKAPWLVACGTIVDLCFFETSESIEPVSLSAGRLCRVFSSVFVFPSPLIC